jgi:hypothetical protein
MGLGLVVVFGVEVGIGSRFVFERVFSTALTEERSINMSYVVGCDR